MWIADAQQSEAEALGYTVVDAESVIVTHLTETIRAQAAQLLTRQDVRALLDQLQGWIDPNHARAREMMEQHALQQGQQFWWHPGELAPDRGPSFDQAFAAPPQ